MVNSYLLFFLSILLFMVLSGGFLDFVFFKYSLSLCFLFMVGVKVFVVCGYVMGSGSMNMDFIFFIYKEGVVLMLVNIFEGMSKEVEKMFLK